MTGLAPNQFSCHRIQEDGTRKKRAINGWIMSRLYCVERTLLENSKPTLLSRALLLTRAVRLQVGLRVNQAGDKSFVLTGFNPFHHRTRDTVMGVTLQKGCHQHAGITKHFSVSCIRPKPFPR